MLANGQLPEVLSASDGGRVGAPAAEQAPPRRIDRAEKPVDCGVSPNVRVLSQRLSRLFSRLAGGAGRLTEESVKEAVREVKRRCSRATASRWRARSPTHGEGGRRRDGLASAPRSSSRRSSTTAWWPSSATRQDLQLKGPDTQSVILLLGLQGSGKTTTAAKLAFILKNKGRKVLLVACDLQRPAAVEQLAVLGAQVGVDVYREDSKDAVKVAKNALEKAKRELYDVLIVDTAGRLQVDEALMDELPQSATR